MCNNTNSNVTRNTKNNEPLSCVFPQASQEETETQASSMKPATFVSARYPTERAVSTRERFFCEACIEHHSRGRSASATDQSSFPAPTGHTARRTAASNAVFQPSSRCGAAIASPPGKTALPTTAAGSLGAGWSTRSALLAPLYAQQALRFSNVPQGPGGGTGGVGGTLGERAALRGGERAEK